MSRRINSFNYMLIPLAMLPIFLHAQFKLKNNSHTTVMKPFFKGQLSPPFSFFLSGFKRNASRADLKKQLEKANKTDTLPSENLTDNRHIDLYNQAPKNSDSNFPAFHNYYFKLPGFTGVISEKSAILSWQSDINENVRFFFIERSTDRKNFIKVGEIDLIGKESLTNFSFTDSSISKALLYYYQVKAFLADGSSITSDFIPVKNSIVELKASLSPGVKQNTLVLKTNQPVRKIEVIKIDGQTVYRNKKVNQEEVINIVDYLPGSYTIKIIGHNGFVTLLFFKKESKN
jgi:hypothetical protein